MTQTASFNLMKEEYAEISIQKALDERRFNEKDAELVRTFTNELQAIAGISISVLINNLHSCRLASHPFKTIQSMHYY